MSLPAHARSVAARFSAAAGSYDEQSGVQRAVAQRLMGLLRNPAEVPQLLEVGCGTGVLTSLLARRFPKAEIHAVDVASAMIDRARERLGDTGRIHWHVADARTIEMDRAFPLIVSSSALHWMVPLEHIVVKLAALLEPDGCLAAALMLKGTLRELHAARLRVAPGKSVRVHLPEAESVLAAVEQASLHVAQAEREELRVQYDSAADFIRSLHELGVTAQAPPGHSLLSRAELDQLIADYNRDHAGSEGGVTATYQVLYIKAIKDRQ